MLRIGARILEADPTDLEIVDGRISVKGAPGGAAITMRDIGDAAYRRLDGKVPDGEDPTLEERDTRLDLVDRKFTATAPNQLWVADITYVRTFPDGCTHGSGSMFSRGGSWAGSFPRTSTPTSRSTR